MLKLIDILDERDKSLKRKSNNVVFPLSNDEKEMIKSMIIYLENSQIEDIATKYSLRPGMGLAGVQVGINKRFFVVVHEQEDGSFRYYTLVNPKIVSTSEELIYADGGEGCLSINREVIGIVPRHARVTIEGFDENGNYVKYRGREELSIAFQHEMDHLDGILFPDKINKSNPFKGKNNMRGI